MHKTFRKSVIKKFAKKPGIMQTKELDPLGVSVQIRVAALNFYLIVRERYQYETDLSLKDKSIYDELFNLAKKVIDKTKDIIG